MMRRKKWSECLYSTIKSTTGRKILETSLKNYRLLGEQLMTDERRYEQQCTKAFLVNWRGIPRIKIILNVNMPRNKMDLN